MKGILALYVCLFTCIILQAQDPIFTQKTGNINHFNPSLVGAQSDFGVQFNYKNQWPTLTGERTNGSVLVNYNFKKNIGVGLELNQTVNSHFREGNIKANVTYTKNIREIETRYGLNFGFFQNSIDLDKLKFQDPNDPAIIQLKKDNTKNGVKIDAGASGYYKGFLVGVAIQQLNEPNVSLLGEDSKRSSRFVGSLAYLKEFKSVSLVGIATYQNQGVFSVLETQAFSQYRFIKLGIGHRQTFGSFGNGDFFSANAGIQFNKFSVGYSYDDTLFNNSRKSFGGTHQATAAWYIKGLNKEKGMNKLMNALM
jgi:type IX secretion system PorP/SprF family membrane protein